MYADHWIRYQGDEEEFSEALAMLREGRGTQAEAEALWLHIARRKPQIGFEQFCVSTAPLSCVRAPWAVLSISVGGSLAFRCLCRPLFANPCYL